MNVLFQAARRRAHPPREPHPDRQACTQHQPVPLQPRSAEAASFASPAQRERGRGEGRWIAAALLAAAAITPPAQAQDTAQIFLRQRALAATCAACHGTEGRAPAGSAMPSLAGRPAPWLIEQMHAFESGAREATVMHQIARGYSAAQIDQLAAYFAAQKP
jgi:cytochrome c553